MSSSLDDVVRDFLGCLEEAEAVLLTWGVVDGAFTRPELEERAHSYLSGLTLEQLRAIPTQEAAGLIDVLLSRRLLFEFDARGSRVYRTRMAEAIRLFARLKQMFVYGHWRSGANLVADFRFALRDRSYPRRDMPIEAALAALEEEGLLSPPRRAVLSALLARPGLTGLAGFQVRATARMLRDLDGERSRGMIVTVGTGSGKTLAFYLPALVRIASRVVAGEFWTKAVAIYPRNELLKDQFAETYREARRLDTLMLQQGRRKILIGAFFGPTPNKATRAEVVKRKDRGWSEVPGGYACAFLRCPTANCERDLVWRTQDLAGGVERLVCLACGATVEQDEVILTRGRMKDTPPDIVFTSTEMLNRVMSDSFNRHIFGIGAARAPEVVLLDEVHTYTGTHGAQVAILLRRWRQAIRGHLQFTGLSATLRNASDFFAQLVGLPPNAVAEIAPLHGELVAEGKEYVLALRGDPVSKKTLLSTTIQAAMLLRRVLDPQGTAAPSHGAYGSRVFLFTDDLDVTNRLYHNLLDAEGVDEDNRRKRSSTTARERDSRGNLLPLAGLRATDAPGDGPRAFRDGQRWLLCEDIGHVLQSPLLIGRTSSQDAGVDRGSDVVVATASLEVGYNDPAVGAVVQHKAPYDAAGFVQRKGRAGRPRGMRPWTVVVLSDYGRDRLAYQGYESLFEPVLPPRTLPVANRYVLRIHATYALMDWVAWHLGPSIPNGSVFRDFSGPAENDFSRVRHAREVELLRQLVSGETPHLENSLARHLAASLRISKDEVNALLWDPPRSLLLHVVPTVLRRLERQWGRVPVRPGDGEEDIRAQSNPLPDFVPASLFSDLNLPEVTVLPVRGHDESLPVAKALTALAPGRVTRRFAVRGAHVSHWIALPVLDPDQREQELAVEDFCAEFDDIGSYQYRDGSVVRNARCIRPRLLKPTTVPASVNTTSNAFLAWQSQFVAEGEGEELDIPERSEWRDVVAEVRAFSHVYRSHVEVRRFATASNANVRLKNASTPEITAVVRFVDKDTRQPTSVGFSAPVDGLRFRISLPDNELVTANDANGPKVRAFRSAYFRHRVQNDSVLADLANTFLRDWLAQVYFAGLCAWAKAEETSLAIADEAMQFRLLDVASKVLEVIFESPNPGDTEGADDEGPDLDDHEADDAAGDSDRGSALRGEILSLIQDPSVIERLRELARVLWEQPDAAWFAWARERYLATLGGALLEACRETYPEAASGDLVLDLEPGPRHPGVEPVPEGQAELWITESTIGGGGVVEEIVRRYSADPRRFFRLVESALGPSDHEIVDSELTSVLTRLDIDAALQGVVNAVRVADGHDELVEAVGSLETALTDRGYVVTRQVMSALHARVLRPGSTADTDRYLLAIIRRWREVEDRLGVEVDARVFAYLLSEDRTLSQLLVHVDPAATQDRLFRFHAIYGLLWPRGNVVRSLALSPYNRFAPLPPTDREIVLDRMTRRVQSVDLTSPDWRERITADLTLHGVARLRSGAEAREDLKKALLVFAAEPIESDYLHLYPQVEGVERGPDGYVATLQLSEAVQ